MKFKSILLAALIAVAGASSAHAAKMWIGPTAGLGMPMGAFSDVASTGFNLGLTGDYPLNESFVVGGEAGWHGFGGSDDFEKAQSAAIGSSVDAKVNIVPVIVHGKWMIPSGGGGMKPYLKLGLGLYRSSTKVEFTGGDDTTTDTNFGYELGAGLNYPVNDNVSWGVDGAFHSIQSDGDAANLITVRAQLHFGFGQ